MKRILLAFWLVLVPSSAACAVTIADIPFSVDPNQIAGTLLPPISGDPNTWSLPVGLHSRTGAARHVAYIEIDYEKSMPRVSNNLFWNDQEWTFEMWIVPGINYKVVKAFADPRYAYQAVHWYTIVVMGTLPAGDEPELE